MRGYEVRTAGMMFHFFRFYPCVGLPPDQALRQGGLTPGGSVCVVGAAGGCGSAGLALAR